MVLRLVGCSSRAVQCTPTSAICVALWACALAHAWLSSRQVVALYLNMFIAGQVFCVCNGSCAFFWWVVALSSAGAADA